MSYMGIIVLQWPYLCQFILLSKNNNPFSEEGVGGKRLRAGTINPLHVTGPNYGYFGGFLGQKEGLFRI